MHRTRDAFTAMEMMIVIGIMALLATLAVPSLLGSMRNGKVNDAANAVSRISSQARMMARTRYDAVKYYGVIIVNDANPGPQYVAMTYGTDYPPTKGDVLTTDLSAYVEGTTPDSKVVGKANFNRNVVVFDDTLGTAMLTRGWLYQYRTGYPIPKLNVGGPQTAPPISLTTAQPTSVGVNPAIPSQTPMSFRSLDGKYRVALAVYEVGITNAANF